MRMRSVEEYMEDLERSRYEEAFPGPERFFINYYRRKDGKSPLRMRGGRAVSVGET